MLTTGRTAGRTGAMVADAAGGRTGAIAVVFDRGAASAAEIAAAIPPVAPLVTVLGPGAYAEQARPLLTGHGPVVPLADGFERTVSTLRRLGVAGVTTFSERMLRTTCELAAALSLPFHDDRTVRLLTDKAAQRRRLNEAAVSPTRVVEVRTADTADVALDEVGFPAVLKPIVGEGSRNTYLIDDRETARKLIRDLVGSGSAGQESALLVEEYLPGRDDLALGDYVSVECAVVGGAAVALAVSGKLRLLPPFRETGQFWPAQLPAPEREAVVELAVAALGALGVRTGLAHVEIKLTPAGPRVIEVNGRLGGLQVDLAQRAAGLDLIALAGRISLGRRPQLTPVDHDDVYFQAYCVAPPRDCRLVRVHGAAEALKVPGVTGYRPFVRPGTALTDGVASRFLCMIAGVAADHQAMMPIVEAAIGRLSFTLLLPDGSELLVPGTELC